MDLKNLPHRLFSRVFHATPWFLILLVLLTSSVYLAHAAEPTYDIILRHGRIVDGTGNPAYHAALAIKDGKVAAIGQLTATARQELDATNLVIAPGFIDVHTHA